MYRKIANTFCKVLIYMIAFVVAALMGIMLIHILMESIPALREVGIKMFLPSSEWRPVSAAPQYGLLPAYRYFVCVRTGSTVCDDIGSGMCLLSYFFHAKETCICLPGLYRSGSRYSIGNLWLYRINRTGKSICKISEDGSGTVCTGGRYCTGNHASAVCCIDMSGITSKCKTDI